jgi:hypothetical protein
MVVGRLRRFATGCCFVPAARADTLGGISPKSAQGTPHGRPQLPVHPRTHQRAGSRPERDAGRDGGSSLTAVSRIGTGGPGWPEEGLQDCDRYAHRVPGDRDRRLGSHAHQPAVAGRPGARRAPWAVQSQLGGDGEATRVQGRGRGLRLGRGDAGRALPRDPGEGQGTRHQGGAGDAQRNFHGRDQRRCRGTTGARRRATPRPAAGGRGELARQHRPQHGRMGHRRLRGRFTEGSDVARGPGHRVRQREGARRPGGIGAAALLLRLRQHDAVERRRILPLHPGADAAARAARIARHDRRGRTGERVPAPSSPRGRRARGDPRRLAARALRTSAEVVLRHGLRDRGAGGHGQRSHHRHRVPPLQPLARHRPCESGRQGVPHRAHRRPQRTHAARRSRRCRDGDAGYRHAHRIGRGSDASPKKKAPSSAAAAAGDRR